MRRRVGRLDGLAVRLAVAFAFRCGLFNIGGTGQYIAGAVLAVWIGSSFEGMNSFLHILLATIAGTSRDGGPACASVSLLGVGWSLVPRTG